MNAETKSPITTEFQHRGISPSRLEGFSDAVFGFALTLLVVSLEVPKTFEEMRNLLKSVPAFAISFTLLVMIWRQHAIFFRRYGLDTPYIVFLNSVLLFLVLLYIYPLKFLFSILVKLYSGAGVMIRGADGVAVPAISTQDMPMLMIIYGLGYGAVCFVFVLMHLHASKLRTTLQLNELEIHDTNTAIQINLIMLISSLISVGLACTRFNWASAASGFTYPFLMAPTLMIYGILRGRQRSKMEEQWKAQSSA